MKKYIFILMSILVLLQAEEYIENQVIKYYACMKNTGNYKSKTIFQKELNQNKLESVALYYKVYFRNKNDYENNILEMIETYVDTNLINIERFDKKGIFVESVYRYRNIEELCKYQFVDISETVIATCSNNFKEVTLYSEGIMTTTLRYKSSKLIKIITIKNALIKEYDTNGTLLSMYQNFTQECDKDYEGGDIPLLPKL